MQDATKVKQFTEETGYHIPEQPTKMTKENVYFLVKMMLDEILELCATVDSSSSAKLKLIQLISDAKSLDKIEGDDIKIIAEQVDALVDCYYYSLNATSKMNINMSSVFDIVHQANMDKRDKQSGKFLKREDGKIIKPEGWKAPDIEKEIKRQMTIKEKWN